jgi:hypothetical protein
MFSKTVTDFFVLPDQPRFVDQVQAIHSACKESFGENFKDIHHFCDTRDEFFNIIVGSKSGCNLRYSYGAPVWIAREQNIGTGEFHAIYDSEVVSRFDLCTDFPSDFLRIRIKTWRCPLPMWVINENGFQIFWTNKEEEYERALVHVKLAQESFGLYSNHLQNLESLTELTGFLKL